MRLNVSIKNPQHGWGSGLGCDFSSAHQVAGAGFESPPENKREIGFSDDSGADSGALDASDCPFDTDLDFIVNSWASLSESLRAKVLSLIRSDE